MKTMGRLLEADGGQLQQPNRLQPLDRVIHLHLFHICFGYFQTCVSVSSDKHYSIVTQHSLITRTQIHAILP